MPCRNPAFVLQLPFHPLSHRHNGPGKSPGRFVLPTIQAGAFAWLTKNLGCEGNIHEAEGTHIIAELWQSSPLLPGLAVSCFAGLATCLGAIPAFFARQIPPKAHDGMLGFAAGAMLFVISDEIIPETHQRGNERAATYMLLVGFILMMFLDTTLG